MIPGGSDYEFKLGQANPTTAIMDVIRAVEKVWPDAIWDYYDSSPDLPPGTVEVSLYKDMDWSDDWDKNGATIDNMGTMVYVIAAAGRLTFVMDDDAPNDMEQVISELDRTYDRP